MSKGTETSGHGCSSLHFRILGALEIWQAGSRVFPGGSVNERVLVALLLEPRRVLPVQRLVETVWDGDAPVTARHQVRKAVADLRRRLPGGKGLIVTEGPGYRADVTDQQLDVRQFGRALDLARTYAASGLRSEAVERLREAIGLWRGPVLSGHAGNVVNAASAALEERQLNAIEQLFELRLASGESLELIAELREAVTCSPFRESLRGQLMTALYRSGRQAEALEEYNAVRRLLDEELGIQPGEALRELHQAVLTSSPELARPEVAENPRTGRAAVGSPSWLPYDLSDFTGREDELESVLGLAETADGPGPLIVAIDGMGGSGKTALATRAGHLLAPRCSEAQLHLDLRGFAPDRKPLTPACAAAQLLRMLGVSEEHVPADPAGRLAMWRSGMARRHMLVVLDDVADAEQVRPLLAASPGSLVLVTSRFALANLDAAHTISLGMMSPADSVALITKVLGRDRVRAETEAVEELAALCGHLPLALRIAAVRLRKRPCWTVRHLVERLRDSARRLSELDDGKRSVAARLRLSYDRLSAAHRRTLRLLGEHPGGEPDAYAVAALADEDVHEVEKGLECLLDAHLVQQPAPGRYALHSLVRSFARTLAPQSDKNAPDTAVRRLLDFSLAASDAACDLLFPGRDRVTRPEPGFRPEIPPLVSPQAAHEWFEREEDALRATVDLGLRHGLHREAAFLAANLACRREWARPVL